MFNKSISAITTATKTSGKKIAEVTKVSGKAIKDSTLYATDYMEIGVCKTKNVVHNKVVVPTATVVEHHRTHVADRHLNRLVARDERRQARAAKKAEAAEVVTA